MSGSLNIRRPEDDDGEIEYAGYRCLRIHHINQAPPSVPGRAVGHLQRNYIVRELF